MYVQQEILVLLRVGRYVDARFQIDIVRVRVIYT
jgi:hypothetical protein